MDIKFTDTPVKTGQGRPRVHIPVEIANWCDRTYRSGQSCEMPLAKDAEEAPAVLRALRIYAKRQDKSISQEFVTYDGTSYLRFRMRDKQTQRTALLPKEH